MLRFRDDGLGRMEGKLHGSRFVFHVVGVVEEEGMIRGCE